MGEESRIKQDNTAMTGRNEVCCTWCDNSGGFLELHFMDHVLITDGNQIKMAPQMRTSRGKPCLMTKNRVASSFPKLDQAAFYPKTQLGMTTETQCQTALS